MVGDLVKLIAAVKMAEKAVKLVDGVTDLDTTPIKEAADAMHKATGQMIDQLQLVEKDIWPGENDSKLETVLDKLNEMFPGEI